jgi:hypothetical protein
MQMKIAVSHLPDRSSGRDDGAKPELVVDHPRGYPD